MEKYSSTDLFLKEYTMKNKDGDDDSLLELNTCDGTYDVVEPGEDDICSRRIIGTPSKVSKEAVSNCRLEFED